jgi:hypothetical protein
MLDELRAQAYERPSVDQLVVMGMHGASVREKRCPKSSH